MVLIMKKEFCGLEFILIALQFIIFYSIFSSATSGEIKDVPDNKAVAVTSTSTTSVDVSKTGINDPDFNRAMPHIIKWEGDDKCSNDPHDRGGRTYMGITIGRAREYGYSDPCKMSKAKVYEIYYKSYWLRVPKNLGGPEKLAYFNMIINGTSSSCLKRPDAMSMLNCQQVFYRNAPTAWKHLRGWTNRNNYMKQVVSTWQK